MYFGAELWREGKSKNPLLFPDTLSYLQTLISEVIRRNGNKGRGVWGKRNRQSWKIISKGNRSGNGRES